jgi:hypothetical protein
VGGGGVGNGNINGGVAEKENEDVSEGSVDD